MRALLLLLMLPALASAQIYRWTDERGQVHYSEKPQAPSAEQIEVRPQVVERDAATRAREERLEKLHSARRAEQQQAAEKTASRRAEQEQQCSQLRKRLTQLEEGGRFYRRGADGSTEYVSDAEVVATRDRLRGEVAAACP